MKVSREFLETIINYSHASSKDETRPFLNTVAIRCIDGNTLELTATDGYVAIRSQHVVTNEMDDKSNYYLVSRDDIPKIKLFIKEWKAHNIFTMSLSEEGHIWFGINDALKDAIRLRLVDRDYPKVDDVYNNKKTCKLDGFSFNPDNVTKLRKCVYGTRVARAPRFDFTFTSNLGPMICKCKHNGIEHNLIFMPMRER